MSEEAMNLALEVLIQLRTPLRVNTSLDAYDVGRAITSLRQAIAEAEKQEPVAWAIVIGKYAHVHWGKARPEYPVRYEIPLYTHPQPKREWVGLTVMEAVELDIATNHPREFAAAIEAKLKDKNGF